MKNIAIIGFGRFGQVLYRLLKDDFSVLVYARNPKKYGELALAHDVKITADLKEAYQSDAVFFAVPINAFESVIKSHRRYFRNQLMIDVLSVKKHPEKIFRKYLRGTGCRALLTHPMFGPDSSREGFGGLPIVMDKFMSSGEDYGFWKKYFRKKGLRIVEMAADEHDRLAAKSQGVTHFIGRLLKELEFAATTIDTLGAKKLQEVKDQTCNDTWELFDNLQTFNPYTKAMRLKLGSAYDRLYNKLLPGRIKKDRLVYGIQGGRGSFNEEAILDHVRRHKIRKYEIKYLYTSEKVLRDLHRGNIDYGLFAIQNAVGGIVQESAYAMARYKFRIFEEFAIKIRHTLMKRKDADAGQINTVMAHPQVFRQCRRTMANKFPQLKQASGTGDLVDTAASARALAEGKIGKNTFILGPEALARLYDLEIIDRDLQDDKNNITTFFLVSR